MRPPAAASRPASERGAVSVSAILLIAAAAALAYAVLGATVTDPDTYGTVAIPSKSTAELPGTEVELSLAVPEGASVSNPPTDLRIGVSQAGHDPLRVDARGGEEVTEDGFTIRPVAAVFPPTTGAYVVDVASPEAALAGGRLMIGEGKTGAIGTRFERIGELITGPFGILALVLIATALLLPAFGRALRNNR
jgi:hypothetical protein